MKNKMSPIETMQKNIKNKQNMIWKPSDNLDTHNIFMNSYNDIHKTKANNTNSQYLTFKTDKLGHPKYKSKKILLILTQQQKNIINKWLFGYKEVYNYTLKYIKEHNKDIGFKLNWMKIRNNIKIFSDTIANNTGAKIHDLDYAIKLICQNYKSAFSNYKAGNIKTFRIRYWKNNKQTQFMDLEKDNFKSGSIRKNILGTIRSYYNGANYDLSGIKCDCRLQRNTHTNDYYLYVPEELETYSYTGRKNYISLDPGIRTFMTGITNNAIIEIGKNAQQTITEYLNRIDNITSKPGIPDLIKEKNRKINQKKITNYVNELHWKTINYLTDQYDNILIGNMSTKGIISNKYGKLDKMTKRIATSLRLYVFHQRLKYKCYQCGAKYKIVDEKYTSKMCSVCGNINENLGGSKIYKCKKCGYKTDRDVNGCRNILLKSI